MEPATLEDLRAQAVRQAAQKRHLPPQMNSILNSMPAAKNVGYQLGIHLQVLAAICHRLWDMLSLTDQFGDDPEADPGCEQVCQQFEKVLGR